MTRISDIQNKTVIISPLDWGLGHATRCIPIIKELLQNNNKCIIASSGRSLELLKQEFPEVNHEQIPEYGISYSTNAFSTFLKLTLQIPKALLTKNSEERIANQLVEKYNADIIIADNRFGMHSNLCKSIFITHQIRIRLPFIFRWLEYPFHLVNKSIISKFDECWIPDYKGTKNISGILSHSWKIPNSHFIGPLSGRSKIQCEKEYDIVAILSGPEPQRGIFETKLRGILPKLPYKSCIIRGVVAPRNNSTKIGNCKIQTFATNEEITKLICGSKLIISRAGYSSIMDYEKLKCKAILVPTPGQSEQVYLGHYLEHKERYWYIKQRKLAKNLPNYLNEILEQA
ncbi:MAG: hypothetical protein MJ198_06650 [Bacteroidales bacterium]|nr:hypothetical protein [Bacteroidales bacterium]